MANIDKDIDISKSPTKKQIEMLRKAEKMSIPFDTEYPGFTKEELEQFYRVKDINNAERQKQIITLRLSPKAARKAHSLGKGYTSILSRILEAALDDPNIIKQFL